MPYLIAKHKFRHNKTEDDMAFLDEFEAQGWTFVEKLDHDGEGHYRVLFHRAVAAKTAKKADV